MERLTSASCVLGESSFVSTLIASTPVPRQAPVRICLSTGHSVMKPFMKPLPERESGAGEERKARPFSVRLHAGGEGCHQHCSGFGDEQSRRATIDIVKR